MCLGVFAVSYFTLFYTFDVAIEDEQSPIISSIVIPTVKTTTIKIDLFNSLTLANGKVRASSKADLRFEASGQLREIHVKNGQHVEQGHVIAVLDSKRERIALKEAQNAMIEAEINKRDLFYQRGSLNLDDTTEYTAVAMQVINTQSGYYKAVTALQKAELNLSYTILSAPFAGIIANLKEKRGNYVSGGQEFCLVISQYFFEAEFSVIEKEAVLIKQGQSVEVMPFINDSLILKARISEINPIVDVNGLVTVKAKFRPLSNVHILDGMNVNVKILQQIPNQLIIPKEALVVRSGKDIVFTYEDGKSLWNYVKVGNENDAYLTIVDGLKAGDQVIIAGNLNLAHDAKVSLAN